MQRLILLGAAEGPWCSIRGIKTPAVCISGLTGLLCGELITKNQARQRFYFQDDGNHNLDDYYSAGDTPEWIRVSTAQSAPDLVVVVRPLREI